MCALLKPEFYRAWRRILGRKTPIRAAALKYHARQALHGVSFDRGQMEWPDAPLAPGLGDAPVRFTFYRLVVPLLRQNHAWF